MGKRTDGGAAFPRTDGDACFSQDGMSLWDYYFAAALGPATVIAQGIERSGEKSQQGGGYLAADGRDFDPSEAFGAECLSVIAAELADAMLAERASRRSESR